MMMMPLSSSSSSSPLPSRWNTKKMITKKKDLTWYLLILQVVMFGILTFSNMSHLQHSGDNNNNGDNNRVLSSSPNNMMFHSSFLNCDGSSTTNKKSKPKPKSTTTYYQKQKALVAAKDVHIITMNNQRKANNASSVVAAAANGNFNNDDDIVDIDVIPNPLNSFSSCLIIMDDNHFLIEWLAYHYYRLPLRRLIIAIDPRSKTSPIEILKRYKNLMKITIWYENDYMPPNMLAKHLSIKESDHEKLEELYVDRQFHFYAKCMSILKKEGMTWTTITDTDEYIIPNNNAIGIFDRLKNISENKTIFEMIQENRKTNLMMKNGCISMSRIQFGLKEESSSPTSTNNNDIQQNTPPHSNNEYYNFINETNFVTMRYRYHDMNNKKLNGKLSKCMVNLTLAQYYDFVYEDVNSHRPIKRICDENNLRIENKDSPFVVNHYAGSWEQWNYRKQDFRLKRKREEYDKLMLLDKQIDDTIRPWLNNFIHTYGNELSKYLLDGVGILE